METELTKGVVLVSGGLDSTTLMYMFVEQNVDFVPLFINYGQHCASKEYRTLLKVIPEKYKDKIETQAMASYLRVVADHGVRINLRVVANDGSLADVGECSDVTSLSNFCRWCYEREAVDAFLYGQARLVELQQLGHTLVCVLDTYERCAYRSLQLHVVVDEHY